MAKKHILDLYAHFTSQDLTKTEDHKQAKEIYDRLSVFLGESRSELNFLLNHVAGLATDAGHVEEQFLIYWESSKEIWNE
jgi:hypothetical protein